MGLLGILLGLALLMWLAYRGWSVLLVGPLAALVAALLSGEPLLAHWTQTFMGGAARFVAQFFPLFLLGALFGKLMDDTGAALAIARALAERLGRQRAILAVVLACAILTYGGVSLFVVAFVVAPVADALFREADVPHRLMPAAIALGAFSFTMTAIPGTPAIQNAIPMPVFGTTPFAAPGLGLIAAAVMLGFGLWWLDRVEAAARRAGEGYGAGSHDESEAQAQLVRERASASGPFDPEEMDHGRHYDGGVPVWLAGLPMLVVVAVNFGMSEIVLPRLDTAFLGEPRWGPTSLAAVGGIWSVATALLAACAVLVLTNRRRLLALRQTMDAGANASVLPVMNTASMVGFGAVVAALPAFAGIRDALVSIPGGPLVSIAVATNVTGGITGSASGGLIIALEALGDAYVRMAAAAGIDPALMHRVAAIGCGGLSGLPHNGAVVTLLAICGATHRNSYRDIGMVMVVGTILALVVIITLGKLIGSF
jgi:H+/gluconate symporter-like permease